MFNYMENNLCPLFSYKNIKKLLKIPYSKSHVSMAVYRIGRTLLLDELDIQELFMRSSQVNFPFLMYTMWSKCIILRVV